MAHKHPKGQQFLQAPLGTLDYPEAIKKAALILQGWNKDWKAIRRGKGTPAGVIKAYPIGKDILNALGDEDSERVRNLKRVPKDSNDYHGWPIGAKAAEASPLILAYAFWALDR